MAARTSSSQTKSVMVTLGAGACAGLGAAAGGAGVAVQTWQAATGSGPGFGDGLPRRARKRSTTCSDTFGIIVEATPRLVRYRSTAAATVLRVTGVSAAAGVSKASSARRTA